MELFRRKGVALMVVLYLVLFGSYQAKAEDDIVTIKNKAEKGDVAAQIDLGNRFKGGRGVPKDCKKSLHWLTKAAEGNDPKAQHSLYYLYSYGCDGIPKNKKKSLALVKKSAESGYAEAQFSLGFDYILNKDGKNAVYWLEKSADNGYEGAYSILADLYYDGDLIKKDNRKALLWYEKVVKEDSSDKKDYVLASFLEKQAIANQTIGDIYLDMKDYNNAILWYGKAAEKVLPIPEYSSREELIEHMDEWSKNVNAFNKGGSWAQYNLGNIYYEGKGTAKNCSSAILNYYRVADHDPSTASDFIKATNSYFSSHNNSFPSFESDPSGCKNLADLGRLSSLAILGEKYLMSEQDVPLSSRSKSLEKAIKYLTESAKGGNLNSQLRLGMMHGHHFLFKQAKVNLDGIKEDQYEASKWYKRAAEQGNKFSQQELGIMYFDGKGVIKDYAQAYFWFNKCAEQGESFCQYILGKQYATGKGVPKNDVIAYAWSNLAAAQGNNDATKIRELIANILTPEQLGKAQELSAELQAKIDNKGTPVVTKDSGDDHSSEDKIDPDPFIQRLEKIVPDYAIYDTDINFHKWMDEVDPVNSLQRKVTFYKARNAGDVNTVAAFFVEFKKTIGK